VNTVQIGLLVRLSSRRERRRPSRISFVRQRHTHTQQIRLVDDGFNRTFGVALRVARVPTKVEEEEGGMFPGEKKHNTYVLSI